MAGGAHECDKKWLPVTSGTFSHIWEGVLKHVGTADSLPHISEIVADAIGKHFQFAGKPEVPFSHAKISKVS